MFDFHKQPVNMVNMEKTGSGRTRVGNSNKMSDTGQARA